MSKNVKICVLSENRIQSDEKGHVAEGESRWRKKCRMAWRRRRRHGPMMTGRDVSVIHVLAACVKTRPDKRESAVCRQGGELMRSLHSREGH